MSEYIRRIKFKRGNSWIVQFALPEEVACTAEQFETLWRDRPEEHGTVVLYGRAVEVPRWQKSYGRDYKFSGMNHEAGRIENDYLKRVHQWTREHSGRAYEQILVNWYQNGQHYIGAHSDDTRQLVPGSAIYSVTLCDPDGVRDFVITSRDDLERYVVPMPNNTVLIMGGDMQQYYQHAVPKRARATGRRINITARDFR